MTASAGAAPPTSQVLAALEARGCRPTKLGVGWSARCPVHDDRRASLSIGVGEDDRVLLNCFAGCKTEDIVATLGLNMADLFADDSVTKSRERQFVTTYDYADRNQNLIFQVIRYQPKTFRQRRPNGAGGWIWNLRGVNRVLYRLPDLLAADPAQPVFIVEGEKDANRLVTLSVVATTNPGGAGTWRSKYSASLKDRKIVILPDNDDAGRAHAKTVAGALVGVATEVKILELPDLPPKGDVSDWLEAGHTVDKLLTLVNETPAWRPDDDGPTPETAEPPARGGRSSQADRLVRLGMEDDVELFHDQYGEAWGRVLVRDHREVWKCRSKDFKRWLAGRLWQREHKAANSDALNSALNVIEAKARFDGREHFLYNRVASVGADIWYDLADSEWRAVKVTPTGWEIISEPPILFRRHAHQRPQTEPQHGGDLKALLPFVNIKDRSQQLLFLVFVVVCFIPDLPHPILVTHGSQGSAKTTISRIIRRIVDPSITEALSLPRELVELVQQLSHHWAPFYDNVSAVPDWISDALCRAVTGEGFSKRELFSDDSDVIYSFQRCVGLNGINVAVQKSDLLDRSILVGLDPIGPEQRKPEATLWREFEAIRPSVFGAALDVLSRAIALHPSIRVAGLPRMADFTEWGCAIAQALGHGQEEFLDAYESNLSVRNEEVIAANPVAAMVTALMDSRDDWEGAPSGLLAELEDLAKEHRINLQSRLWPKAAHSLTRRLNEVRPNLEAAGILVASRRDGRSRYMLLQKIRPESVTGVTRDTLQLGAAVSDDAPRDAAPATNPDASPEASPGGAAVAGQGDGGVPCDASLPYTTVNSGKTRSIPITVVHRDGLRKE